MTAPDVDLVARACRCGEVVSVPLDVAETGAPVLCGACLLRAARVSDPVHVSEIVPAVVEAAERGRG